jgi:hypothetical protein
MISLTAAWTLRPREASPSRRAKGSAKDFPLMILDLAVAANCQYTLTHNLRHFRGMEKWGIGTATPSEFLKQIEKET